MVGYITQETGRESDKFMLRLPDGMKERIKKAADENRRSMNAEIVATLEREYPAERYSAEDLLADLDALTRPMSIEDKVDKSDRMNGLLRYFGANFEVAVEGEDIILMRANSSK